MVNSPKPGSHDGKAVNTTQERKRLPYRRAAEVVLAPKLASDKPLDEGGHENNKNKEEGEDDDSYSISSKSQVAIKPVYENGRRYCNDRYHMPNDDDEQTRLNIIHQAFLLLLDGRLTRVPLPPGGPKRVLDVGTGPGDWAVEMGQLYPNAEIVATDISVFDGGPAILGLPNVHFQIDDAEQDWTYNEPFDFIHFRDLSGSFRDWEAVYKQAFKHLTPGGYIEVVECDPAADTMTFKKPNPNSYYNIIVAALQNAAESLGYPRSRSHLKPSLLTSVGFVDASVHDVIMPVGPWPKDPRQSTLGKMVYIAALEGLEATSLRTLTASGQWTAREVRDLCDKVKQEIIAGEGLTSSVRFLTGRKPDL